MEDQVKEDPTPIEFYRITHANKEGIMSKESEEAYVNKFTSFYCSNLVKFSLQYWQQAF